MLVISNDILQCSTCERIRLAFQCLSVTMSITLSMSITKSKTKTMTTSMSCRLFCSMYIWPFFSCFPGGKCRLLYFYIHLSLIDQIFTFSLQPGSGGKPFPDILCDCCCSWPQHNIGLSNVEQTTPSVARLKLDSASSCGVTRYREELRIFSMFLIPVNYK